LEDLHTNIKNLEIKLTTTNSSKVKQHSPNDKKHKQNIKLDSNVLIHKIDYNDVKQN